MRSAVRRALVRTTAAILGVVALVLLVHGTVLAGGSGTVRSVLRDGIIKVDTNDASIADIIEELSRSLGFEVHGDVPSTEATITRSLEGSLEELLSKILRDASYVLVMEAGAPKRLTILSGGPATPAPATVGQTPGTMSIEQLRKKEGELVMLIAQYEDMSEEAREHANPELSRKFKQYAEKLAVEAAEIRVRLAPYVPKMQ